MRSSSSMLFIIVVAVGLVSVACPDSYASGNGNTIKKIGLRNSIERKARKAAERGELDAAIDLYRVAMRPEYINYDHEKSVALGALEEIYKWKGDYEKSLAITEERLRRHPEVRSNVIEKMECEALVRYKNTEDPDHVLKFIAQLQIEYADWLPPIKYNNYSPLVISDIIRLYDTIGDHDAGITYIDDILAFFKTGKAGDPKPGWVDAEYVKVRKAFEMDKSAGTKGRATKALIQSDYFPW